MPPATLRRPVLVLLSLLALVATGCSSLQGTGDKGYITGDGVVRQVDAADRGEPVELVGEGLDGEPIDLAALRGQVVVVNVWGSWCPPCRAEMPDIVEAQGETEGTAQFVGINIRDNDVAQGLSFNRAFGVDYPSVYDPSGRALLAFTGTLTPRTIPATVVLDAEGRIAASVIGPLPSATTLVDLVEDAGGSGSGSGAAPQEDASDG